MRRKLHSFIQEDQCQLPMAAVPESILLVSIDGFQSHQFPTNSYFSVTEQKQTILYQGAL